MPRVLGSSRNLAPHFKYFLVATTLLLLGFVWAIASPQGSSADEDFHSVSIYCVMGESEVCQFDEATGELSVPGYLVNSRCYASWPAYQGAGCLDEVSSDFVTTTHYVGDSTTYGYIYFRVMTLFAGTDYPSSVLTIRLVNVGLASVLLLWVLLVSTPAVRRGVALSWGVVLVPVGIFFIASINPSAWLIIAIGTFWAFLATLVANENRSRARTISLWLGLIASMVMALGSRIDSVIYLTITTIAVLIWKGRKTFEYLGARKVIVLCVVIGLGLLIGLRLFLTRYQVFNFSFPGAQTSTDQPNAVIKNLVELPAFLLGLLGGQGPQVGLATGATNEVQEGHTYSGFYYGIGWMDFSLPPLVSIITGLGLAGIVFVAMRQYSISKFLSLIFVFAAVVVLILFMRATIAFAWGSHIQPRYIFPIFLAGVGLALTVGIRKKPLLSRLQAGFLGVGIALAGAIAWLATATRYAVGPNAAYTNFGQTPEWWWNIGPGRLGWFLITVLVSGLWAYSTIWIWGRASRCSFQTEARDKVSA